MQVGNLEWLIKIISDTGNLSSSTILKTGLPVKLIIAKNKGELSLKWLATVSDM